MATNGEFSSRAFLNNKIDLVQAEAINDIINATTAEAKDLSMASLSGETSNLFRPIRNKIGEILANIEVNIDFPEYEDIEEANRDDIVKNCQEIAGKIEELIQDGEKNRIFKEGIKIAIVGKPNVGKSSLLNALIKEDKAIVTSIAGTTRDVVEGQFNLCGVPIYLFDTAGIRESDDQIEKIGIDKAKKTVESADLVLFVVDETGIDEELYNLIKNQKHIIVNNKADIYSIRKDGELYISAKNNDVDPLLNKIKEEFDIDAVTIKPSFNNLRQLGLLKTIHANLLRAIKETKENKPIDLISVSLMTAYNCSLELLGEINKNDLTDEIFSRFCVGK